MEWYWWIIGIITVGIIHLFIYYTLSLCGEYCLTIYPDLTIYGGGKVTYKVKKMLSRLSGSGFRAILND